MKWPRKYVWAGLAVLAAVLLRLYAIHHYAHIMGDALVYGDLASNIIQHHQYAFTEQSGIRSTLIRLPGYPLLMAACFALFGVRNFTSVLYLQLILDIATCLLLGSLAGRLLGPRAKMWALWLAALCPFTALYVAAPYTETPAIFCVALAFYSLERWHTSFKARATWNRWLWPLALSLAYSCLLRPDRALLAVAVIGAMAWLAFHTPNRRHNLRPVAAVCVVILLPLAIWTARNWRVFHVIQPLAPRYATDPGEPINYGFQRWYRTWGIDFKSTADIYWNFDGSAMSIDDLPSRAFDSTSQRERTEALFAEYNRTATATPVVDAEFAALAAERVHAHPFNYYIALPIARVANMWLRPRTELLDNIPLDWWRLHAHPKESARAIALGLINLTLLALAAAGLWRWRRQGWTGRRTLGYAIAAFILLRSALLLTVDNSEPRYTMDCYPLIVLLASFALASRSPSSESR